MAAGRLTRRVNVKWLCFPHVNVRENNSHSSDVGNSVYVIFLRLPKDLRVTSALD